MSDPTLSSQVGGSSTTSHGGPPASAREHAPAAPTFEAYRAGGRITAPPPARADGGQGGRDHRNPHHGTKHSTTEERSLSGDATEVVDIVDDADTEQSLRVEVLQLRRAMQTRPVIDLARGVLMASFGLDPEEAWSVLVTVSQNANIKLFHLAEGTVAAVTGEPLPEALRQQLSAAVAELAARRSAAQETEP
ncbi:hypothetical protein C6Y14_04085 [Streptomyces dioscori]|uniref:ANTAR domain-containing protein n=1 Tax=Streptomyces dioscori TaxID=2109333 RepID=A0A2P8QG68_9ACTN|nr:hypothetical protein C6Y14_04085 [Streptomyces dioscori]